MASHRHAGAPAQSERDLASWFPELTAAAKALPAGTLVDGEIVICDEHGWVEFGRLQERLSTLRTRVVEAACRHPAVLVVFDVLEIGGRELTSCPLNARRRELEDLLGELHPCLQLVAQTTDVNLARDWLTLASLEGVVAKRADRPYIPGRARDWIKVKRLRTVDCVVIGVAGDKSLASQTLLYSLRRTSCFPAVARPWPSSHSAFIHQPRHAATFVEARGCLELRLLSLYAASAWHRFSRSV